MGVRGGNVEVALGDAELPQQQERPQVVCAEKLLYDAALQFCRDAAVQELVNNQNGAANNYVRGLLLLGALSVAAVEPQDDNDKAIIRTYAQGILRRLSALGRNADGKPIASS